MLTFKDLQLLSEFFNAVRQSDSSSQVYGEVWTFYELFIIL